MKWEAICCVAPHWKHPNGIQTKCIENFELYLYDFSSVENGAFKKNPTVYPIFPYIRIMTVSYLCFLFISVTLFISFRHPTSRCRSISHHPSPPIRYLQPIRSSCVWAFYIQTNFKTIFHPIWRKMNVLMALIVRSLKIKLDIIDCIDLYIIELNRTPIISYLQVVSTVFTHSMYWEIYKSNENNSFGRHPYSEALGVCIDIIHICDETFRLSVIHWDQYILLKF